MLRLGWIRLSTYGLVVTDDNQVVGRSFVGNLPLERRLPSPQLIGEMPALPDETGPVEEMTGEWDVALSSAKLALADTQMVPDFAKHTENDDWERLLSLCKKKSALDENKETENKETENEEWAKLLATGVTQIEQERQTEDEEQTEDEWATLMATQVRRFETRREERQIHTQSDEEWTARMASQVSQYAIAANDDVPELTLVSSNSLAEDTKRQRALREIRRLEQHRQGALFPARKTRQPRDFDTPRPISVTS